MFIENYWQTMVGYVAVDGNPIGTVFFVSVEFKNVMLGSVGYAVTCRHVIERACKINPGGISILVNERITGKQGEFTTGSHAIAYADWFCSKESDLAVCRFDRKPSMLTWWYPLKQSWSGHPRVGQDVFFVGMLSQIAHKNPLEAIVRSGSIAHFGIDEDIYVDRDEKKTVHSRVYLVESRSWGGESGSPVLVHSEHNVLPPMRDGQISYMNTISHSQLVGIMHGHFENESGLEIDGELIGNVPVNSGIAIVIPVGDLWKFLYENERVLSEREQTRKEREQAVKHKPPKPDSTRKPGNAQQPFTKADFESALRKISKRIPPSRSDEGK